MKADLDHVLFTSAYLLCLMDALIFGYSTFSAIPYAGAMSLMLRGCAAVLIFLKLMLDRHYSLGLLIRLIITGLVLLIAYVKSGYSHVFYMMIVFLGMRDVDHETIISIDFWAKVILCLLIVSCGLMGIIENYITYRTNSTVLRYSVGFNHPNTLASLVLSLILEDAWIYRRRSTGFYSVVIWIIATIIYFVTANRTAVLIMIFFPLALFLVKDQGPESVKRRSGSILFAVMFAAMSVFSYMAMIRCRSSELFRLIDRALSNRFYNSLVLFNTYGISVLGQHVSLISVKVARLTNSSIALLDVAYLRLLIQAGPIVLTLLAILNGKAMSNAWKNRNGLLVLLLSVFLLFGLCESGFNNVFMNFALLFTAKELYGTENNAEEDCYDLQA